MRAHLLDVLVAYYLDGLTERETVTRLNLTRQRVRTYHKQAIEFLRRNYSTSG
jgi:DNA-directed RNA polymerase specialized sigma subunit